MFIDEDGTTNDCNPNLEYQHSKGENNELGEVATSRFCVGLTGNERDVEKTHALPHHWHQGDASPRYESGLTHNL